MSDEAIHEQGRGQNARPSTPVVPTSHSTTTKTTTPAFLKRLRASVEEHSGSRVVLALDFVGMPSNKLVESACSTIDALAVYICSIKINMHLLLPLSMDDIKRINDNAHSHGLQSIADIKLNDIPSTNNVAIEHLAESNFDALTLNPIMGLDALNDTVCYVHRRGMGAIALVYMSHKSAESSYGMQVRAVSEEHGAQHSSSSRLYRVFLEWALASHADGIVVGATRPEMIRECRAYIDEVYAHVHGRVALFSPGGGAQGGDPSMALSSGADYIIVGRSILHADDPVGEASRLAKVSSSNVYANT